MPQRVNECKSHRNEMENAIQKQKQQQQKTIRNAIGRVQKGRAHEFEFVGGLILFFCFVLFLLPHSQMFHLPNGCCVRTRRIFNSTLSTVLLRYPVFHCIIAFGGCARSISNKIKL